MKIALVSSALCLLVVEEEMVNGLTFTIQVYLMSQSALPLSHLPIHMGKDGVASGAIWGSMSWLRTL